MPVALEPRGDGASGIAGLDMGGGDEHIFEAIPRVGSLLHQVPAIEQQAETLAIRLISQGAETGDDRITSARDGRHSALRLAYTRATVSTRPMKDRILKRFNEEIAALDRRYREGYDLGDGGPGLGS